MKSINTEAVVLKHSLFKDNDKIITLLTKDLGKISGIAKGVRKFTSKRAGQLDTLTHVKVGLVNYSERYIITEVKSANSFPRIKSDYELSRKAFYMLELVHRFLEEGDARVEIYNLLISSLLKIEMHEKYAGFVVKHFELKLLAALGYEMTLDKCAKCGRKFSNEWRNIHFNLDLGGLVCDQCTNGGFLIRPDTANLLSYLYNPIQFRENTKTLTPEADHIVYEFMERVLGKPVKSIRSFGV